MNPDDPAKKSQEFFGMFLKAKEFTEDLLKENERLRFKVAHLEAEGGAPEESDAAAVRNLTRRIRELEGRLSHTEERYRKVEDENKEFADRYIEIEEQNNNLANLYVASYQLHSTLDFREVIQIVQEIVINLIGSEAFAILLLDEKTNELKTIAYEGGELVPGIDKLSTRVGEGTLGTVAKTGQSYYINQDFDRIQVSLDQPLAAIPLKIKEHVIGLIVIYRLLQQKDSFSAVDFELFSLLAAHAATAIFASKLYSQSERKLNTIQSFLDLLTTQ